MDILNKPIRCEFCGSNTWILEGINQCPCPENNFDDFEENFELFNNSTKQLPKRVDKKRDYFQTLIVDNKQRN